MQIPSRRSASRYVSKSAKHLAISAACAVALAGAAQAELLYASTGTTLSQFDSTNLSLVTTVPYTGLVGGDTIVGIDVRVANAVLYGIGSGGRVYSIAPSGAVTQVGASGLFTLSGTAFGTDFNPVPDRIRQVSNQEQSLRLNPNDGTLSGTDSNLTPAGNIVAVAYDRNDTNPATLTTLFGIDSAAGTLVMIGGLDGTPSPNLGAVTTIGSLGLGSSLNENIGLDVSGLSGIAYATITTSGLSRLYSINLATGSAGSLGTIGTGTTPYLGVAAAGVPEPSSAALLALGGIIAMRRRRV